MQQQLLLLWPQIIMRIGPAEDAHSIAEITVD